LQGTLILAIRIGLTIEQYWNLTPAEFFCYVEAYKQELEEKGKNETANGLFVAWNTANYSKAKRLPNLANTIKNIFKKQEKPKKSKRMSDKEIKQHYNNKVVK
jgi:hypothetical protein